MTYILFTKGRNYQGHKVIYIPTVIQKRNQDIFQFAKYHGIIFGFGSGMRKG